MSTILNDIVRRLRSVPSAHWELIAQAAGCAKSLPRKLATGDRQNPGVLTIQPLVDYFARVDAGKETFPPGSPKSSSSDSLQKATTKQRDASLKANEAA